jgi:hypothetical protein
MFGADYVHISRMRKSGLLELSLNISLAGLGRLRCHQEMGDYLIIVTEISNEVENNTITRLHAYTKQYVPRRTGAAGGSSGGGGSSGRS